MQGRFMKTPRGNGPRVKVLLLKIKLTLWRFSADVIASF